MKKFRLVVLICVICSFSLSSSSRGFLSSNAPSLKALLLDKAWQIVSAEWNYKRTSVDLSNYKLNLSHDGTFVCTDFNGREYSGEWILVDQKEEKQLPQLVLNPGSVIEERYLIQDFEIQPDRLVLEQMNSMTGEANITYTLRRK
jgi:uncharacterized secreted protein with C-terminal beta-propeller domain